MPLWFTFYINLILACLCIYHSFSGISKYLSSFFFPVRTEQLGNIHTKQLVGRHHFIRLHFKAFQAYFWPTINDFCGSYFIFGKQFLKSFVLQSHLQQNKNYHHSHCILSFPRQSLGFTLRPKEQFLSGIRQRKFLELSHHL